jgi:hypothetical protein
MDLRVNYEGEFYYSDLPFITHRDEKKLRLKYNNHNLLIYPDVELEVFYDCFD